MPYSSEEGKSLVKDYFSIHSPKSMTLLDIGPGAGVYADLFDEIGVVGFSQAVEVWAPYIKRFNLDAKYNRVIIADVRYLDWDLIGWNDIVVLGDVLEHLNFEEAKYVMGMAMLHGRWVVASFPIVEYPQGAEEGNPYEEHISDFSDEALRAGLLRGCKVITQHEGNVTGTYIIEGLLE